MSILQKLACSQNRRDEVPNQELARQLAQTRDEQGIAEIAANLWNRDKDIHSDCIKVLYEIGYLAPELIAAYHADLLKLLKSKNNRMVWGAMIALSTIAALKAEELYAQLELIQRTVENGSVITVDAGILTLAAIAAHNAAYNQRIFPDLLKHLGACRPKDIAQCAEKIALAVNAHNKAEFLAVLEQRKEDLSGAALSRVKKVVRQAESIPAAA